MNFLSNYPGRDRIQELQQIDFQNNPRDTSTGTASDFRHAAAMNELSKSLSPGFVPDFVGDSLAYGLGYINEVPDMFRGVNMGQLASGIATMNPNTFKGAFQPEAIAAAQEDLAANKLGTFRTPNTATIEDVFAKTLGYQAPGTNIQTASAIGNPMGYGAAQASDLTNLERDFPGMSTGDIIDSMNNRQRADRFSGMGQVGPNKSNMNAPAALDMDRFAGVSNLGRNDMDVEQVEQLGSPSRFQGFKNQMSNFIDNPVTRGLGTALNFARGSLPGMVMSGIGSLFSRNPNAPSYQSRTPGFDYNNLNESMINDFYDSNPDSDRFWH